METVTISKSLLAAMGSVLAAILVFLGATDVHVGPPTVFGALSGPDISSPYLSVNGVTTFYNKANMKGATTTACSFKSPSATSTLRLGSVNVFLASSSAVTVYLAKGANNNATTSNMGTLDIVASGQMQTFASTTVTASQIFAPNTYFNVGVKGQSTNGGTGVSPIGNCSATFDIL